MVAWCACVFFIFKTLFYFCYVIYIIFCSLQLISKLLSVTCFCFHFCICLLLSGSCLFPRSHKVFNLPYHGLLIMTINWGNYIFTLNPLNLPPLLPCHPIILIWSMYLINLPLRCNVPFCPNKTKILLKIIKNEKKATNIWKKLTHGVAVAVGKLVTYIMFFSLNF